MTVSPLSMTVWSDDFGDYCVPQNIVDLADAAVSALPPRFTLIRQRVKEAVIAEWARGIKGD